MLQRTSKCLKHVVSPAETLGDMGTLFFLHLRKLQVANS